MRRIILNIIAASAVVLASGAVSGCHSSRHTATATSSKSHRGHKGGGSGVSSQPQHIAIDRSRLSPATAALLAEADSWLGVPYRFGGEDRGGVDCSALVLKVFEKSLKIAMPRNSRKQAEFCSSIKRSDLMEGDLVFFSTPSSASIGHVGIYIGGDRMIHASSSRGVVISSITDAYFRSHFKMAGRVDAYFAMLDPAKPSRKDKNKDNIKDKKGKKDGDKRPADDRAGKRFYPDPDDSMWLASSRLNEETSGQQAETPNVTHPVPDAVSAKASAASAQGLASVPAPAAVSQPVAPKPVPAAKNPAPVANPEALSPDEARKRVIAAFREQPADSVMTSFFE